MAPWMDPTWRSTTHERSALFVEPTTAVPTYSKQLRFSSMLQSGAGQPPAPAIRV